MDLYADHRSGRVAPAAATGGSPIGRSQLQFRLDEEQLGGLKEELIEGNEVAVDEDGKMLVWKGDNGAAHQRSRGCLRPLRHQRLLPRAIRLRIWPSAFAPNKQRWKRAVQQMVSAKPSPRCLPISKARPR